jgi:beta-galactosidase
MPGTHPRTARRLVRPPPPERLFTWLARPGQRWRSVLLGRPAIARLALAGLSVAMAGCVPAADAGTLPPTLTMVPVRGGQVAMQDGIPVPTFGFQPRNRVDLGGLWQVERRTFDSNLSLAPRSASLARIVAKAGGRERTEFDATGWSWVPVPGSLNPPPDRSETGGWYRRQFFMPWGFGGKTVLLRFGAANYLADVWLNGVWLGYHEGGSTPFAFDATAAGKPGQTNTLAVRVDNPAWGSRNDIVPWGLADWWNSAGLTRPVWLESSDPVHAVRADVTPHLDGADVSVVVQNSGAADADAELKVDVFDAHVTPDNVESPDPQSLLDGAPAVVSQELPAQTLRTTEVVRLDTSFLLAGARTWSPLSPSLYVLRVSVVVGGATVDTLMETFGLRQVAVDPLGPSVLLNGYPVWLPGVAIQDQRAQPAVATAQPGLLPSPGDVRDQLARASAIGARLVRTGHMPANPTLLDLADRRGIAIWEEIPLYHYTPQTFGIAMGRGIPQQMLREMALRDMNHPSVLFHGLANESTGEEARTQALQELRDVDRAIDGTRLTGQAAYGFNPTDPTSEPLDVAGYTSYQGVFYGSDPARDTADALASAHRTYPGKPIVILEFGRWADGADGIATQQRIFTKTAPELLSRRSTLPGGYVSAAVWWTLDDYATLRPNLEVEHFGLYAATGAARPVAESARSAFSALPLGLEGQPAPPVRRAPAAEVGSPPAGPELVGFLAYGLGIAFGFLALAFGVMVRRGGGGRRSRGRSALPS